MFKLIRVQQGPQCQFRSTELNELFWSTLYSGLRCTAFAKSFARALDGFDFLPISTVHELSSRAGIRTRGCQVRSANATSVLFRPSQLNELTPGHFKWIDPCHQLWSKPTWVSSQWRYSINFEIRPTVKGDLFWMFCSNADYSSFRQKSLKQKQFFGSIFWKLILIVFGWNIWALATELNYYLVLWLFSKQAFLTKK